MWKSPSIHRVTLALNGAPKSMGRKGCSRKKSNKKANIEEVVNISPENEIENSALHSRSPNNVNDQMKKPLTNNI